MAQIFGIHSINGLPDSIYSKNFQYQSMEYLPIITIPNQSSVYISSEPAGAQIFIDGIEQIGFKTPSMITDIPSGNHNFKITRPGYIDIESSIPLESGKTYNIFLSMQSLPSGSSLITPTNNTGIIILIALGLGLILFNNIKKK